MIFRVIALCCISFAANAVEVVFPSDGWYQLQDEAGVNELCNSDAPCNVPAGVYKLINHTTGETNNNFAVNDAVSSDGIEFTRSSISCNNGPTSSCAEACPVNTNPLFATCEASDFENGLTIIQHVLNMNDRGAECSTASGQDAQFNMTLICVNAPINNISRVEVF